MVQPFECLLQHNYYPFGLGAVGIYCHPCQCFFNVEHRRDSTFHSRGLICVEEGGVQFISGNMVACCLAYRIRIFGLLAKKTSCAMEGGARSPDNGDPG